MKLEEYSKKQYKAVSNQLNLPVSEPLFKPGDIVYFKPLPNYNWGDEFPAIGSEYEVDCKVFSFLSDGAGSYTYRLTSGRGYPLNHVPQDWLVASKLKYMYSPMGFVTSTQDTELFPKDTVLTKVGEYYGNDLLGVYIHASRFESIKGLFK